jgi:hypothetical protein
LGLLACSGYMHDTCTVHLAAVSHAPSTTTSEHWPAAMTQHAPVTKVCSGTCLMNPANNKDTNNEPLIIYAYLLLGQG